jgi:hypothetical protein
MGRILDAVGQFFKADDWPHTLMEEKSAYKTGFEGKNGQFNCYAQERAELDQFVFYAVFPVRASESVMPAVVEFITRANSGMIIGNFELDYADGEIRYKTSVDVEDVDALEPLIRHLVYASVVTMDKYFKGLMRVIYAGISPADAITEVEGGGE